MSPVSRWSVICEPLDWQLTAADVLQLVRRDAHPAALTGTWAGGSDIVCAEPTVTCRAPGQPWDALDRAWPAGPAQGPGGPVFGGGWIGYLGFGLAGQVLPVPPPPGVRRLPSWWLGYYDHVLRRDRASGRWFFEALATPERAAALQARLAELRARARQPLPGPAGYSCGEFRLIPSPAEHRSAVRRCIDYIRRGDIFQANICLRLEACYDGDPLDAFCAAVTRLDPPYAAFLRPADGCAVASLSPELFLRRNGRTVSSRPIKGTRARPGRADDAAAELAWLQRSAKNLAENVMIVDLMRSDLSRVCVPGSVAVPVLTAGEPHPGVWHLVSEVTGELGPGAGDGDLVRAAFPPGSVTGAPKVRAIEVIHELEATPREVYTGAIGYRSPLSGLELNVAIRTFEFCAGRVWLGAGGGIVAASRPAEEYRECLVKAGPLIAAVGGRIATGPASPRPRSGSARRHQAGREPALLPRPAAGIFTSVAVREGTADRIGGHLSRLDSSARLLFGKSLPPQLADDLARCLARRPTGRLRITVRPLGGPLQATVEVVALGDPPALADLVPVLVPGGIGGHKWADRRLLAEHARAAGCGPASYLLIEDTDGHVLEADRANVFAVTGGVLRTPPADGRLLPGITRAAVLRLAAAAGLRAEVTPLTRRELATASEVFLTNSVHGLLPVRSVGGTVIAAAPGPATARLTTALAADTADPAGSGPRASRQHVPRSVRCEPAQARRGTTATTVILIDNYDSFTYNLAHYLASAGCAVEVVRNDEVTAGQIADRGPAGVVISPGPCAPADAGISIDAVRACAGSGIPLLGICLGHQAIAACYGAAIITAPGPVHGRTSVITHDGRGLLEGLPLRFTATRYHSLIVDEQTLPPCLCVTARTRGGLPMALRHATLPIDGLQFHPESILTRPGQTIITSFARRCAGMNRDDRRDHLWREYRVVLEQVGPSLVVVGMAAVAEEQDPQLEPRGQPPCGQRPEELIDDRDLSGDAWPRPAAGVLLVPGPHPRQILGETGGQEGDQAIEQGRGRIIGVVLRHVAVLHPRSSLASS